MKKLGTGIVAVLSVVVLWAPAALAATPEEIYKDLADNGRLDGTYSQAEIDAFLQSAAVQGYGNPTVVVVPPTVAPPAPTSEAAPPAAAAVTPPVVTPAVETPAAPSSGVAGESKTIERKQAAAKPQPVTGVAGVATPAQAPLTRAASAETLPFTGIELGLFALVGTALLLGGLLLRASARQR